MLDSSINPSYQEAVELIQSHLKENKDSYPITQSIVELWKFIYLTLPDVDIAKVPGYPEYRREWAALLVDVRADVDWELTYRDDWDYYRIVEHYAKQIDENTDTTVVDASEDDIRSGAYWS